MSIGIYKITSPSGRIYIGQSVHIERRIKEHKSYKGKLQNRLYNSLKKYESENHTFDIIEECSVCMLNERERYWQDHYDVLGVNGLNCTLTRSNDKSGMLSLDHRIKIGKANKGRIQSIESTEKGKITKMNNKLAGKRTASYGRKRPPELGDKIRKARKGMKFSESHLINLSKSHTGKKQSEETINKRIKSLTGQKRTEEHKINISKGKKPMSDHNRRLLSERAKNQITKSRLVINTETGIYYDTVRDASKSIGCKSITLNCKLLGYNRNNTSFIYA